MSGQNFSAGLRPAVCFGAQKSCFGGSKWCSSDFEGFETIFKRFLGNFGCFSSIFAWYRMPLCRATGQGSPGAAPHRLNVGNLLDVDRPPLNVASTEDVEHFQTSLFVTVSTNGQMGPPHENCARNRRIGGANSPFFASVL